MPRICLKLINTISFMKVVFLGGCYSDGYDELFIKDIKGTELAIPSSVYMRAMIEGIYANNVDIRVISCPNLPGYPINNRRFSTQRIPFLLNGKELGVMESYNLFFVTKEHSAFKAYYRSLSTWYKDYCLEGEEIIILSYSPAISQLGAAIKFKHKHQNVKLCCIITDLFCRSIKDMKGHSFPKKIQHGIEIIKHQKYFSQIDSFVLLTKGMEEKVPEAIGKNVIIEGIASPKPLYIKQPQDVTDEKILLYTGSLAEHTSIKELVDAFMLTTNPNFRLYICGAGYYEKYITEAAQKSSRIVFKGLLPHTEVIDLQHKAIALINPRFPSIKDTPYSFPSKTMEYLISGTPMIGYKLVGIPTDYYECMYTVNQETPEDMASVINHVLSLPQSELDAKARSAYNFIMKNKTAKKQASKLIEFLKK